MAAFSQVYDIENLRRAYRWVLSNPDPRYKNYFRDDYAAYALGSERNIKILSRQIRSGRFEPTHASKIYLPKANGILRPISLLTVNDQISYQACVNVIAEELLRRVRHRYGETVFFHQYAGKTSAFFYKKWKAAYAAYSRSVRRNFHDGLKYVATFDLTAFYDSIDHSVLRIFLQDINIDRETIDFLMRNLRHWTEATWSAGKHRSIFHEHGIPQGPLSSGMLSEVVLQHIDRVGDSRNRNFKYIRYVDDIKIMAKDERTIRRKLVSLDILSKEIGLFPQGAKIAIRRIEDPESEIKSVSIPYEPAASPSANQDVVQRRIRGLSYRGNPKDPTKFKYILSKLIPSHKTNGLLLNIALERPELSDSIFRHFEGYDRIPKSISDAMIEEIIIDGVYHSVNSEMMNLLYGRLENKSVHILADFSYERLFAGKYKSSRYPVPQPSYRVSLIRWAIESSRITYHDILSLLRSERDWWVLCQVIAQISEKKFGKPSYEEIISIGLRSSDPDPARMAASIVFSKALTVPKSTNSLQWPARILLQNVGLIRHAGRPPSLIGNVIKYTVNVDKTYDWRKFFGSNHDLAEKMAILSKQRFETDIDAFVVSLDSLCDLMTRQVYVHNGHAMVANYGSALGAGAPSWLRAGFPGLRQGFGRLHALRIRSFTAHPQHRTGEKNRRITHYQYYRCRLEIKLAIEEIISNISI